MASRRNYDVGQGFDARGRRTSGVFESSWRVTGASTAEVAALTAMMQDPTVDVVHWSCVERFGALLEPPSGAIVHFHGDDDRHGSIIRYTVVTRTLHRAA